MKLFTLFILIMLSLVNPSFADVPEISAIDIYPSGAKFTFTFKTENKDFAIELPGAFESGTIRILNPLETEDVKIITENREKWIPQSLSELNADIETQQEFIRHMNSRKSSLELAGELLRNTKAPEQTDAKDIISYIQMAQEMKLNTEDELTELNSEISKENAKLNLMKTELEKRMPINPDSVIKITGHLKSGNELKFEAFTTASRWQPSYTMDLDTKTGKIDTRLYSRASQNTGLDYTGNITFHTKTQNENVTAPKLNPLRVGIKPKEPAMADYAMPKAASRQKSSAFNFYGMSEKQSRAPAPIMESTLSNINVQGFGTLTGENNETEFILGDLELTGETLLVLIPEQRKNAWIVVSMDEINKPLIPARASLRVDGQPSGNTSIPEYGLSQKQIAFGYAPQITAEKKPIVAKTGTSWFSGVYSAGYKIKVTNGMNESKKIIIRDRLPIPTDDKIKLEVKRIDPAPKERDNENRLTWELEINSGETKNILVDYSLSYPQNEELSYR